LSTIQYNDEVYTVNQQKQVQHYRTEIVFIVVTYSIWLHSKLFKCSVHCLWSHHIKLFTT